MDHNVDLVPREQMDLPSRLSASNASFRSVAPRLLLIQKVPQSVRGGLEERYFVPDVVSIGPYHHRARPHLVDMEEVKEAVVHEFCNSVPGGGGAGRFLDAVRPLLVEVKHCYADNFDNLFNDSEFANMMVVDGCFLLAVMAILTRKYPEGLEHRSWTHGRMLRIIKDVLLFENQIPWVVLRALMALHPVPVDSLVDWILAYFEFDVHREEQPGTRWDWNSLNPFHLLDLVHQRHLGRSGSARDVRNSIHDYARPFPHFTSAVELAEAGIQLHGSGTCRVRDVQVEPSLPAAAMLRLRIGRLVLPRLSLSWLPRCWLINMVALECVSDRSDNNGVSSYLAILGSLIRAERDVEELRSRRILFSTMSDRRTVEFFEGILDPVPRQELYLKTLEGIVQLRTRRSTRSGIHAVIYRNRRIILALAPLLSLLVAIVGIVVNNSIKHK
ncbi:hypothetical protein PAHAL_7G108400 [Panicum hallii]|jgi:hypothetical protein|uniref:Uncharacterized protein n=1 Tax=Panicum hallii TaxID=206008 RepID=A0A2T8IBU3_9POAL|nr:UPF0481 protein At3g47200-like [Panicum hallii]PVH35116.1 hypothetical protein PAHAL_7G108400 [Panicum hallii]